MKNLELRILPDEMNEDPRTNMDFLGLYWIFGKYSNNSDPHTIDPTNFTGFGAMEDWVRKDRSLAWVSPLYCYEHSGSTVSLSPFSCIWDSGQLGFVACTRAQVFGTWGWKRITAKRRKVIDEAMRAEFETFKAWWEGEVYGWVIVDGDTTVDSCWGYYGKKYAEEDGNQELERLKAA